MPQFELEHIGAENQSGLVRARTPEQAIRQWAGLPKEALVELITDPDFDRYRGWSVVRINGQEAGRIRPHNRMRFRRD